MQLQVLLLLWPEELRRLEWSMVERERAMIGVPADIMKMKDPHLVPLARQSLRILDDLRPLIG